MGRRIRGKWDVQSIQTSTAWELGLAFFLCGLLGCGICKLLNHSQVTHINAYFMDFLRSGAVLGYEELRTHSTVLRYGAAALFLLLLGTTPLGTTLVPVVLGTEGLLCGFSSACCYRAFGFQGTVLWLLLAGIAELLWAPLLALIGGESIHSARRLTGSHSGKEAHTEDTVVRICVYLAIFLICMILERLLWPRCFKIAVSLFL